MGQLIYGATATSFTIDDRALAHLEMVILSKLRRNEGFALTIDSDGGGHTTLWLGAQSELRFVVDGARASINKEWLERLVDAANSPAGLAVLPEQTGS